MNRSLSELVSDKIFIDKLALLNVMQIISRIENY